MDVRLGFVYRFACRSVEYTLAFYVSRLNLFGLFVKLKERVTSYFTQFADEFVLSLFLRDLFNSGRIFPFLGGCWYDIHNTSPSQALSCDA